MTTAMMTGLTGRLFEWSVLGRELVTPLSLRGYMSYQKAMALARRLASWDPTDPEPQMANTLHFYVCEALGVECYSEVRFYSALGTPLDLFHGVDCWIEVRGRVVTIDLTANGHKDYHKADVVVHPEDLEDGGKGIARRIASFLQPPSRSRKEFIYAYA